MMLRVVLVMVLAMPLSLFALTEEEVLRSVQTHHPKIVMMRLKLDAQKGDLRSKQGAFDTKLSVKSASRTDGYYSGDYADVMLSQPLPLLNATLYSGYRLSDGTFPVYEDEAITNTDGEYRLGLMVSLLGDGRTNDALATLRQAKLGVDIADTALTLEEIKVANVALKHYWAWVYYGQVVRAYDRLYEAAKRRQAAIGQRIQSGDLPQTYQLENQRILFQRQADVLEAKQSLDMAANTLSLYYRTQDGHPKKPTDMPDMALFKTLPEAKDVDVYLASLFESHPFLVTIALEQQQLKAAKRLADNQALPQVDIGYEISDDAGDGSRTRAPQEGKVLAKVTVPLQRRKATGKQRELAKKIEMMDFLDQWTKETMQTTLTNTYSQIQTLKKAVAIRKQALDLAHTLYEAEDTRFQSGDSTFFQLNTSEQLLIKTTLDYLKDMRILTEYLVDYRLYM